MRNLNRIERWVRGSKPGYRTQLDITQLDIFKNADDQLIRMADDKNLDGAAMAYVPLTLSCVICHKIVREAQRAEAPVSQCAFMLSGSTQVVVPLAEGGGRGSSRGGIKTLELRYLRRLPTTPPDRLAEGLPDSGFQTHPQAARKRASQFDAAARLGDNRAVRSDVYFQ